MVHYYLCCRKTVKWTKKFVLFLLQTVAQNGFILFKNYTTNRNQKGKGCAFKDVMLDCVLKMTEPAEREDKKDGADDEPLSRQQQHRHNRQ
jgi:hypothetical protein